MPRQMAEHAPATRHTRRAHINKGHHHVNTTGRISRSRKQLMAVFLLLMLAGSFFQPARPAEAAQSVPSPLQVMVYDADFPIVKVDWPAISYQWDIRDGL